LRKQGGFWKSDFPLLVVGILTGLMTLSSCKRPVLPLEYLTQIVAECQQDQFPKDVYIPCTATGIYSDGSQQDVTQIATWQGDNSIVTIGAGTNPGWVRGVASGSTILSVTIGSIQGTLPITVTTAAVVECAITPFDSAFYAGETAQYSSICIFSDSTYLNVTSSASWSSSSPATATVATDLNHNGLVTAVSQGTSIITATFDGVVGVAEIIVLPKQLLLIQVGPKIATVVQGLGLSFTATGIYTDLSTVDLTPITTWSVTNGTVASISNTTGSIGYLTALQVGNTTVVGNFGGFSDTAAVTVTNPVLNSITVSPVNPSIAKGLTQAMVATGHYSDGSSVNITSFVTWGTSNGAIASVSNSSGSYGATTAVGVGSATISATLGAIMGSTTFTVTPAQLVSIAVTPSNSTISVTQTEQLTATGTYTDSSMVDITTSVVWGTSDGTIASVSNIPGTQGVATGVGGGTAVISAVLGSITGLTNLTVTPATLTSITVTPSNPTISGVGNRQLTATGHYSDGSSVNITTSVTWTTGNPAIFTVSNISGSQGLATGVSVGSATVFATLGATTGQTIVTVIPPVLISIAVTPTNSTIKLLATKQFTATGTYGDGSTINLTASVTWASSNVTTATISANGLATGLLLGSTTISATLGAISGSTTLTATLF